MKTSETIGSIADALAKASKAFRPVVKDRVAHVKSDKGSYSFAYADLASCIDAVREALCANGIAVVQAACSDPNGITVETRLVHASGEWMESAITMRVDGNRPQNVGSAITYARRYGLSAMVGISSEEDDDANTAEGNHVKTEHRNGKDAADKIRTAASKNHGNAKPAPATPEERKADLKARMVALGIPGASIPMQLGEWIGREVDGKTVITVDDWMKANEGIEQAKANGETLARARANVEAAFNDPRN